MLAISNLTDWDRALASRSTLRGQSYFVWWKVQWISSPKTLLSAIRIGSIKLFQFIFNNEKRSLYMKYKYILHEYDPHFLKRIGHTTFIGVFFVMKCLPCYKFVTLWVLLCIYEEMNVWFTYICAVSLQDKVTHILCINTLHLCHNCYINYVHFIFRSQEILQKCNYNSLRW